jgi:folate-binding protein YgfZ
MTANIAHLASRALIGVSGPDWRSFLQGLITQDVETLAVGEMRYGAILTPQGRLLHDLFITGDDKGAVLDVAASARDDLIARLTLYRLRAKVLIEPLDGQVFACWKDAPPTVGPRWVADPRTPLLGFRAVSEVASHTDARAEDTYDLHRLSLGVADPAKDCASNDYPIEANLDLLYGIDFKKGCFVGQETTSRMHRRGVVKTRMAPVTFEGPPPPFGAPILAGDLRAGEIRGSMQGRAMALLRIDRSQGALRCEDQPIVLSLPTWLAPLFETAIDEASQS